MSESGRSPDERFWRLANPLLSQAGVTRSTGTRSPGSSKTPTATSHPSPSSLASTAEVGKVGGAKRPGGQIGVARRAPDLDRREAVDDGACFESRSLLDDRAGAHYTPAADHAVVADDRAGLDDGPSTDVAAVDHRSRADDDAIVEDQIVVREKVQDGVLEDLDVVADPYRSVCIADDLDARADDRARTDDDVARYLC